jgi:hypothetical protein
MILLLGDWVPEQNQPLLRINTRDEFVLLNLEGPILLNPSHYLPGLKTGPHLYSTHLPHILDAACVCFSLANNHIKDYGWTAIQETLTHLKEKHYHWVGVGENEFAARRPLLLTVKDNRYAILSLCEIQAGRATSVQSGSATIGPWIYQAITQLRSEVDTLILSVHAANEFLPWPSPFLQDLYRSYIDAGVDIVHGHHSHVPQGVESYKNGLICYGLGNFIGSPIRYRHFLTQHSLGVRVNHLSNSQINYQIEPYRFLGVENHVLVTDEVSERFDEYLTIIQKPLENRSLLEALWQEMALWLYDKYGRDSINLPYTTEPRYNGSPKQRFKSLARRMKQRLTLTSQGTRQNQLLWYHIFTCLSHQHMMETALGLLCGEIADVRNSESHDLATTYLTQISAD